MLTKWIKLVLCLQNGNLTYIQGPIVSQSFLWVKASHAPPNQESNGKQQKGKQTPIISNTTKKHKEKHQTNPNYTY